MKNCSTKKELSELEVIFKTSRKLVSLFLTEGTVGVNDIDESQQEVKLLCSQNTQDMFDADATFDDELIWQKIMDDVTPKKFEFQSV